MEMLLQRLTHSEKGTLGVLFVDKEFYGFVPEDPPQVVKIKGQTRIPSGRYRVILEFSPKFSVMSQYAHDMLTLVDVPNFDGIRIHIGNDPSQTNGCILVNYQAIYSPFGTPTCGMSTPAYRYLYSKVAPRIEAGEECHITVRDEDALFTQIPINGSVS